MKAAKRLIEYLETEVKKAEAEKVQCIQQQKLLSRDNHSKTLEIQSKYLKTRTLLDNLNNDIKKQTLNISEMESKISNAANNNRDSLYRFVTNLNTYFDDLKIKRADLSKKLEIVNDELNQLKNEASIKEKKRDDALKCFITQYEVTNKIETNIRENLKIVFF